MLAAAAAVKTWRPLAADLLAVVACPAEGRPSKGNWTPGVKVLNPFIFVADASQNKLAHLYLASPL